MKIKELINKNGEQFGAELFPETRREHLLAHGYADLMNYDVWNQVRVASRPAPEDARPISREFRRTLIENDLAWHKRSCE